MHDNGLIEEVIPSLVNGTTNHLLTHIPSIEEIKNAVFSMSRDGAPGWFWCIFLSDIMGDK